MTGNQERHFYKTVECLYRQRKWLVLLANSYVQNVEASEDIVNDSFISLMENAEKLDEAVMKQYLVSTVKNKCLNWLKRRNCEQIIFKNLKIKAIDAQNINILKNDRIDFNLFSREVMNICQNSLKKTGYISSQIFLERLKGLSYKEIAQKYNMTQRQVTYEISKVLSILKDALKDYLPVFLALLSFHTTKLN